MGVLRDFRDVLCNRKRLLHAVLTVSAMGLLLTGFSFSVGGLTPETHLIATVNLVGLAVLMGVSTGILIICRTTGESL